MKNSLNRVWFWGVAFILLQNGEIASKPIQLIPGKGQETDYSQIDERLPSAETVHEFWEGTPPSVIETYFPKLPLKLTSPLLRQLRLQLIKEPYTDPSRNMAYDKVMVSLITEGGECEQGKELLMGTNLHDREAHLLDLQWLGGNAKKACEKINNLIRTSPQSKWKKQHIYCLYCHSEVERAKIATELLAESDPADVQLLNILFDPTAKPPLDKSIATSPFLLTLWLESEQEISEDDLNKLSSSSLALIARSPKTLLASRLLTAEKALQQGTLKPEEFAVLLKEVPETSYWGQVAKALQSSKTEEILPLLERAKDEKKLGLVAQVFSSSLASLNPSLENLSLAPFMIQAFLQTDEKTLAKKWGAFMMREAPEEAVSILPLLHIAFKEYKWGMPQMQAWQAYEMRVHPTTAPQRSYEIRRILEVLGEPTGEPMKGEPSPPSWRQEKEVLNETVIDLLNSAASSQRKGEVLLHVLILAGETPLHELSVDKLVPLLKALNKAGYEKEARSLALEFLLQKGT